MGCARQARQYHRCFAHIHIAACLDGPFMNNSIQTVTILGSTGSIGINTLKVLSMHSSDYRVYALTAHTSADACLNNVLCSIPLLLLLPVKRMPGIWNQGCGSRPGNTGTVGRRGACRGSLSETDRHRNGCHRRCGRTGTHACSTRAGKKVLLANKEALVMAGELSCRLRLTMVRPYCR